MARAKRKTTTPIVKTADEALFKLHGKFCEAYGAMLALEAGSRVDGKTKTEKVIERKWNRAVDVAFDKARAVIEAPAHTLDGMLMKIHIAGFCVPRCTKDSFSAPYHGKICADGKPQQWEPPKGTDHPIEEELALILSLRADLQRFAGRRS